MGRRGRQPAIHTYVDTCAPSCEQCGSPLWFATQDGRAIEECPRCGWRYVETKRPVVVLPTAYQPDPDRDVIICLMLADKQPVAQVARHFNLTESRIRQIRLAAEMRALPREPEDEIDDFPRCEMPPEWFNRFAQLDAFGDALTAEGESHAA